MSQAMTPRLRGIQREAAWEELDQVLSEHPELEFSDNPETLLVLTLCALLRDDPGRADGYLAALEPEFITSAQAMSDYGLILLVTGNAEEARKWLEKATAMPEADGAAFARLGSLLMMRGDLEKAEKNYEQSLLLEPDKPEILSNMGGLRLRQGALDQALELYERALIVKPDLPQARQQRNQVLIQLGRAEDVVEEKQNQLSQTPDDPQKHLELALALHQTGRTTEAIPTLEAAIDRFPEKESLRLELISLLFAVKAHAKAGQMLKVWLEDEELDFSEDTRTRLRLMLNEARIESGFLDAAEKDLEEMEDISAHQAQHGLLKARLLIEQMRGTEAVPILEDLLERFPGLVPAYTLLSQTLSSLGRMEEAARYSDMVADFNPGAIAQHVESRNFEADESELASMQRLFDNPVFEKSVRASMGFTLHKVLDKKKEYEQAFEVLAKANEMVKSGLAYDWRTHRKMIQDTVSVFTPDLVESLQGLGHPSKRPIFIVGMPRSGTTLTEQILAAHSRVFGAGELPFAAKITRLMPEALKTSSRWPRAMPEMSAQDLKNAGAYYLEKVSHRNNTAEHTADKMPHNFDYVGLIALMFPHAKIIHLDRDPLDTGLSNFQQNFGAIQGTMGFAFDLDWIGHMLNDHNHIMAHWHKCFPGRIFELNYQRLVTEPEATIKALLEFCELDWEDNVMQFSKNPSQVRTASIRQVRQGIYTTSTAKWKRYESRLEPVARILEQGFRSLEDMGEEADSEIVTPDGLFGITR